LGCQFYLHDKFYDEYFVSWGEVCAAAHTTGMMEVRSAQSNEVPALNAIQLSFELGEED
jgi:hypothetical protein